MLSTNTIFKSKNPIVTLENSIDLEIETNTPVLKIFLLYNGQETELDPTNIKMTLDLTDKKPGLIPVSFKIYDFSVDDANNLKFFTVNFPIFKLQYALPTYTLTEPGGYLLEFDDEINQRADIFAVNNTCQPKYAFIVKDYRIDSISFDLMNEVSSGGWAPYIIIKDK